MMISKLLLLCLFLSVSLGLKEKYEWGLLDHTYIDETQPVDLGLYPHDCVGQISRCPEGFTIGMRFKQLRKPSVHEYTYLLSSGGQNPLSDGYYVRQNYAREFEVAVAVKDKLWKIEFHLNHEGGMTQMVFAWSPKQGLHVYVDGIYVSGMDKPMDRIFIPYKIDPFPRILVGMANNDYYLPRPIKHMFEVRNVTHLMKFSDSAKIAKMFVSEMSFMGCADILPAGVNSLQLVGQKDPVLGCRQYCAQTDRLFALMDSSGDCACTNKLNFAVDRSPMCNGWFIYVSSHLVNKPGYKLNFRVNTTRITERDYLMPNESVIFNVGSDGDEPETYYIDFGDGVKHVTTDKVFGHEWLKQGEYTVKIVARTRTLSEKKEEKVKVTFVEEGVKPEVIKVFSRELTSLSMEHELTVVAKPTTRCVVTIGEQSREFTGLSELTNSRKFELSYSKPGLHKVKTVCKNKWGENYYTGFVIVRDMKVDTTFSAKRENPKFALENVAVLAKETSLRAYIVPGPKDPQAVKIEGPSSVSVPQVKELDAGQYVINLESDGRVIYQHILDIQEAISGLTIEVMNQHVITDVPVEFKFTVARGDMAFIEVDYGDGFKEYFLIDRTSETPSFTKQHVYKNLGLYEVTMEVANDVSHEIMRSHVSVERLVERVEVDFEWVPDRSIPVLMEVFVDHHRTGEEPVYVEFDYGDGTPNDVLTTFSTPIGSDVPIRHERLFPKYGMFMVKVIARNNISSTFTTKQLQVGQNITHVDLLTPTQQVHMGQEATIHVSCPMGSPVTYELDFGDGETVVIHQPEDYVPETTPATTQANVTVSNVNTTVTISTNETIHRRSKREAPKMPLAPEGTLEPNTEGTVANRSNSNATAAPFTTAEPKDIWVYPKISLVVKHKYQKPGVYKVKVKVNNMFSEAETWLCPSIVVFNPENSTEAAHKCTRLIMDMEPTGTLEAPLVYNRSDVINIEGKPLFTCIEDMAQEYSWQISQLNVHDGVTYERPALDVCETKRDNPFLIMPPRTLSYGKYRLFGTSFLKDDPNSKATKDIFMEIIPSKITAKIERDLELELKDVIKDESIIIDMVASGDPDVEPGDYTGMTLSLFCYTGPKEKDYLNFGYKEFLNGSRPVLNDDVVYMYDMDDCFATKPKVEFMPGKISFIAEYLNMEFPVVFRLFARKDIREASDKAKFKVWASKLTNDNALSRIEDLLASGDMSAAIGAITQFSDALNDQANGTNGTGASTDRKDLRGKLINMLGTVSERVDNFDQVEGTTSALDKVTETKGEVTLTSKTKAASALDSVSGTGKGRFITQPKEKFVGLTGSVVATSGNIIPETKPKAKPDAMFGMAKEFKIKNRQPGDELNATTIALTATTVVTPFEDPTDGYWTTVAADGKQITTLAPGTPKRTTVHAGGRYFTTIEITTKTYTTTTTQAPTTTPRPSAVTDQVFGIGGKQATTAWSVTGDIVRAVFPASLRAINRKWDENMRNRSSGIYRLVSEQIEFSLDGWLNMDANLSKFDTEVSVIQLREGSIVADMEISVTAPKVQLSPISEQLQASLASFVAHKNNSAGLEFDPQALILNQPKIDAIINPTVRFVNDMNARPGEGVTSLPLTSTVAIDIMSTTPVPTTTTTTRKPPTTTPTPAAEEIDLIGNTESDEMRLNHLLHRHDWVCYTCGQPIFNRENEFHSLETYFTEDDLDLLEGCCTFKKLNFECMLYYEDPADVKLLLKECRNIEDAVLEMQKENERNTANKAFGSIDTVGEVVLGKSDDEDTAPQGFDGPGIAVKLKKSDGNETGNETLGSDMGGFSMPPGQKPGGKGTGTKFMATKSNPYSWSKNSNDVQSGTVSISYVDKDGNPLPVSNTSEPIIIKLAGNPDKVPPATNFTLYVSKASNKLNYHRVTLPKNESSLHMIIKPLTEHDRYRVYMKYMEFPNETYYDHWADVPEKGTRYDPNEVVDVNATDKGDVDLKFTFFPPMNLTKLNGSYVMGVKLIESSVDYLEKKDGRNHSYSMRAFTSGCKFWNVENETWESNGCEVGPKTTVYETECLCTHLTSFGGDFVVPPNTIDFNTVWAKFKDLDENAAVFSTVVVILGLYVIGLIYCRHKDKQDVVKWGAAPLEDNLPSDDYHYLVTVVTGMRKKSGTDSKCSFIMSGDDGDSGVRCLSDGKRHGFRHGTWMNFVMSTEKCLGPLTYLRIWHDNSGKAIKKGWYLDHVEIVDLQTGKRSFFLCNKWLAVEEDDGMVERILPVAGMKDLAAFNQLFSSSFRKKMTNEHLWFSIMNRPTRSNFTRVQRVSCCMSLLFMTMIANAMFFKSEDKLENVSVIKVGPFVFTMSQLFISVVSTLIVFPPTLLLVTIFRKTKPANNTIEMSKGKGGSKSQRYKWKRMDNAEFFEDFQYKKSRIQRMKESVTNIVTFHQRKKHEEQSQKDIAKREGQRYQKQQWKMPHFCIYFAWILCFFSVITPAFFVILYSMEWGREKANSWLTTFLMSFFQDVAIVQPIKVFLLVAFISFITKKPEMDDEEDEEETNGVAGQDEELIEKGNVSIEQIMMKRDMAASTMKPPDMKSLEEQRQLRHKEMKMEAVLKEVLFYFIFVMILFFLSYQTKSMDSHAIYSQMTRTFETPEDVVSPETFWEWVKEKLIPAMYAGEWYNGKCASWRDQMHITDRYAYRVGVARFRQLRIRENSCAVPEKFRDHIHHCRDQYNWLDDDTDAYLPGWKKPANESQIKTKKTPWTYQDSIDLRSFPYMGMVKFYKGGGYAVPLARTSRDSFKITGALEADDWVDKHTRAVFTEFNLYNANVNLFTSIVFLVEFLESGGAVSNVDIKIFKLYDYVGGFAVVVILFQVAAVGFIIYFTWQVVKQVRIEKAKYFKEFWNMADFVSVVLCCILIVMFLIKQGVTYAAVAALKESGASDFVNFVTLAQYQEIYGYCEAIVVFISTVKMIKLLRFNKRMSMVGDTLRRSSKDLKAFSFVFFVYFIAFGIWGYMLFGSHLQQYAGFMGSLESLFAFALGSFDFVAMQQASGFLGPIFFFMYVFVVYVMLMAIFMTILCDSVAEVKEDVSKQSNEYEIVDFVMGKVKATFGIAKN